MSFCESASGLVNLIHWFFWDYMERQDVPNPYANMEFSEGSVPLTVTGLNRQQTSQLPGAAV